MRYNTRGSVRIIAAGGGLLGLVIVIAIMLSMSGESAKQAGSAKKSAERELSNEATGNFAVVLEEVGMDRAGVIDALGRLTGLEEAGAEAVLDSLPATIASNLTRIQADRYHKELIVTGDDAKVVEEENP